MSDAVEIVLANNDRVTLRVGDTFLKIDADAARSEREAEAIRLAPVPTPEIRWHRPPVLALAALPGRTMGKLGKEPTASPAAWRAAGQAIRSLHDAPLPPFPGRSVDDLAARLATATEWFGDSTSVDAEVIGHNRQLAEQVLRDWTPAFIHGDLHLEHLFVDGDDVSGIIDWSEACQGDALYDLASLTLANEACLDDLLAGYGTDVDRELIRGWWSYRCLVATPWLVENGYGAAEELPEVAVLHDQMRTD